MRNQDRPDEEQSASRAAGPSAGYAADSEGSATSVPQGLPDCSSANGDAAPGRASIFTPSSSPSTGTDREASAAPDQPMRVDEPTSSVAPASLQHAISPTSSGQVTAVEHPTSRDMGVAPADGESAAQDNRRSHSKVWQPEVSVIPDEGTEASAGPGSTASSQSFYDDDEETPFSQVGMFALRCQCWLSAEVAFAVLVVLLLCMTSERQPLLQTLICWLCSVLISSSSSSSWMCSRHQVHGCGTHWRVLRRLAPRPQRGTGPTPRYRFCICNSIRRGSWLSHRTRVEATAVCYGRAHAIRLTPHSCGNKYFMNTLQSFASPI